MMKVKCPLEVCDSNHHGDCIDYMIFLNSEGRCERATPELWRRNEAHKTTKS